MTIEEEKPTLLAPKALWPWELRKPILYSSWTRSGIY